VIVVDSSALVDVLAAFAGTGDLRDALAAEELHAPTLIDFEVVSSVRGLTLAGHLSAARGEDLLQDFEMLPLRRWPFADPLRRRAFALRNDLSAYDAAYVTLAEALGCPLVTRDARLARSSGHLASVELL
jgi:predicted nucleic acid-binding protein